MGNGVGSPAESAEIFLAHRRASAVSEKERQGIANLLKHAMYGRPGLGWRYNFCSKKISLSSINAPM
jgi:hypothetical protein